MKPVYLALAAALFLLPPAHAQQASQGHLSLYAGASLPQGDFGATDGTAAEDGSGFASLGGAVVGEYIYPLGTPGLGVVGSIAAIGNKLDVKASIDQEMLEQLEDEGADLNVSSGYWINVPVMAGLRYETEASSTVDVYGLGKAGVNVNQRPNVEVDVKVENESATLTESYDRATSLGFGLGAGAVFNDQINVSLRYLSLGTPNITGEAEVTDFEGNTLEEEADYDQPLSTIQIMVGITL